MVDAALVDRAAREANRLAGNARRLRQLSAQLASQAHAHVLATVVVKPGQPLDDSLDLLRLAISGAHEGAVITVTVAANGADGTDPREHE